MGSAHRRQSNRRFSSGRSDECGAEWSGGAPRGADWVQLVDAGARRAINATDGRCGKVFAHRYHATQIRTPRQARCALAYVLNNWRHHREDLVRGRAFEAAVDPYSSGLSFTGWKGRGFRVPSGYRPLPVTPPATALLRSRWARFGRLDPFECPGPPVF